MATKTQPEARLTIESEGNLMFWIKVDGEITDLILLSDLRRMLGLSQKTLDGIDQIYEDLRLMHEREEE